jgi:hypothetical protein
LVPVPKKTYSSTSPDEEYGADHPTGPAPTKGYTDLSIGGYVGE